VTRSGAWLALLKLWLEQPFHPYVTTPLDTHGGEVMEIRIAPDTAVSSASAGSVAKAPSIPPVPPPPAIANISPFGDLLGRLRELSDSSPDAFRHVAGQLQAALQEAASSAAGTAASTVSDLAQGFGDASRTGSMAKLQAISATSVHGPEVPEPAASVMAQHVEDALQAVRGAA
jgi:hypothetical protein